MADQSTKLPFRQFLATVRWLFLYFFKLTPGIAIARSLSLIARSLLPLGNAYIMARLLDGAIKAAMTPGGSALDVAPQLGLMLVFNIGASALQSVDSYLQSALYEANSYIAPQRFHQHIASLGIQTLENPEVANKIQRAREITPQLATDFERAISFFSQAVSLIVSLLVVVRVMPIVIAIVVVSIVPELFSNRHFMRESWKLLRKETENRRRANMAMGALIEPSNLQEITITGAHGFLGSIYKKFADAYIAADLGNLRRWTTWSFFLGSMTDFASIFGYFVILRDVLVQAVTVGSATFQMRALDMFVSNMTNLGNSYASVYERCTRMSETKELFEMKPMVVDGTSDMPVFESAPRIAFRDVSFKYPHADNLALKNLNLTIRPGEKIAIVGENGAGKTTLVKLLCRFYQTTEGEVLLNSVNVNGIRAEEWYKNLSVLFQDYNTYSALTVKENIYLGNAQAPLDEARMKEAAEKANISPVIAGYKSGYDQVLSEKFKGGTRPSTGQWQKIAIARFFYRNSPVVIFDEPTASIDAVSESEIFGQIYDFFKNKTVIIISHRFSTVRNADKIYVLDKGEIAESGSHDELMENKGKYYRAFTIQAEGYKQ